MSTAVDSTGTVGAMCSLDSNIVLWTISDNAFYGRAKQNPSEAWGIAFIPRASPEDTLLLAIAGGSSNRVRVWDIAKGAESFSV